MGDELRGDSLVHLNVRFSTEAELKQTLDFLYEKSKEGIAFTDYLIRIRIQRACDLMMNTDLKAYEIAEKVGYDTPAYYSTAFKKVMGLSPTEYKKMSMQKGTSI